VLDGLNGRIDMVLDGGACTVGVESTIVDCTGATPVILRPGGISRDEIATIAGSLAPVDGADRSGENANRGAGIVAPGMLTAHYAPRAEVVLNVDSPEAGDAILDFNARLSACKESSHAYVDLSPSGELVAAAANLFAMLRSLDAAGARRIAVARIPGHSLGEAINDRLTRAAAGR
jgi:L-threonylcarbamoyladenylate synthase